MDPNVRESHMPDAELPLYANRPLTPRQDRIEAAIERALRSGGTRSELRESVQQFADHARLQQIPLERALLLLNAVATRGASSADARPSAVGDSLEERLALIARWCTVRYYRVD